MKLMIDIDDEWYNTCKAIPKGDYNGIMTAIANGIPITENATNGDMIKALFPNIEIYDSEKMESVYTGIPFGKYVGANVNCMRDWWNAPYKSEVTKNETDD